MEDETVNLLIANHSVHRFLCIESALDTTKKWKLNKALGKNLWTIA